VNPNPHVLIAVEKPNEKEGQKWEFWRHFLDSLKKDPKLRESCKRLTESLWQFHVPTQLSAAYYFWAKVQESGLDPKMFYSGDEIQECEVPPKTPPLQSGNPQRI
jgi:hypothetical protein